VFRPPAEQFDAGVMTLELEFTKLRSASDLNAAGQGLAHVLFQYALEHRRGVVWDTTRVVCGVKRLIITPIQSSGEALPRGGTRRWTRWRWARSSNAPSPRRQGLMLVHSQLNLSRFGQ